MDRQTGSKGSAARMNAEMETAHGSASKDGVVARHLPGMVQELTPACAPTTSALANWCPPRSRAVHARRRQPESVSRRSRWRQGRPGRSRPPWLRCVSSRGCNADQCKHPRDSRMFQLTLTVRTWFAPSRPYTTQARSFHTAFLVFAILTISTAIGAMFVPRDRLVAADRSTGSHEAAGATLDSSGSSRRHRACSGILGAVAG